VQSANRQKWTSPEQPAAKKGMELLNGGVRSSYS
jgi:hypothetical protein